MSSMFICNWFSSKISLPSILNLHKVIADGIGIGIFKISEKICVAHVASKVVQIQNLSDFNEN